MNLELRSRTLKALGWILTQDHKRYFVMRPNGDGTFTEMYLSVDKDSIWEMAPPIEMGTGIAVDALRDYCLKNDASWLLHPIQGRIGCSITPNKLPDDFIQIVYRAETVAEACCLAICAAGGSK